MTMIDTTGAPRPAGATGPDDIVRVVFLGWENNDPDRVVDDGSFIAAWDSRNYRLNNGQQGFIPAAAVFNAAGDPRSAGTVATVRDMRGVVGFVPDRATEVRRLRMRYANHAGDDTRLQTYPKLEVYDLDGNRLTTVLDDPEGTTVTPAPTTVAGHEHLLQLIQLQQQQLARLMAAAGLDERAEAVAAPVTPQDMGVPEDEPNPSEGTPNEFEEGTESGGPGLPPEATGQFGLPEDQGGPQLPPPTNEPPLNPNEPPTP